MSPTSAKQDAFASDATIQRWFVYGGIAALPLMFAGLLLARVLPPDSATWDAARVVAKYSHHPDLIQLGGVLAMVGFALWGPWTAVMSVWIWRMEWRRSPTLTFTSIILTAINIMVVELMAISFAVTAFRAGHVAPQITLTLNDVSWFLYYFTWPPYALWLIVIALAILRDRNTPSLWPRWLAWLTLAEAVTTFGNAVQTFSWGRTGPLAWNGWIARWGVASFHGVWTMAMAWTILKAISAESRRGATVDADVLS